MDQENRIIVLIDMDCFYCQVEEKLNPDLKGKPIAVVQYNPWKGGGIIAVNYVARARGVTRHMRGDEAKEKCPEIELPSVPCLRGKADISKYRDAGKDVAKTLQRFTPLLERASIDEAYLDITAPVQERLKHLNVNTVTEDIIPNTFALGYESVSNFISDVHNYGSDSMEFDYEHASQLLVGAVIVSEIRAAVYNETGYKCSAGIAHNKILAKLVCGMNKPDKQTILPKHSINILYSTLSVKKVKNLGGKFGDSVCEILKIKSMGQLQGFSLKELQTRFDEKNGMWLYNIARGIDLEPVQAKFNPKSIGCCKQFKGKSALVDLDSLKKWLTDLGDEIDDRLEKDALENNRTPKQMVVSFSTYLPDGRDTSSSRSYNFTPEDELCGEFFTNKALDLVMETSEGVKLKGEEQNRKLKSSIKFLGISVGKFEDNADNKKTKKIVDYFAAGTSKDYNIKENSKPSEKVVESDKNKNNGGKDYIFQKFFQGNKSNNDVANAKTKTEGSSEKAVVTTLAKQESFFARFLINNINEESSHIPEPVSNDNEIGASTTPVCDVLNCRENSSDGTEYSGSTINMEINKSIALFDDNDQELSRISSMRQLLNSSKIVKEDDDTSSHNSINEDNVHYEKDNTGLNSCNLDNKSVSKTTLVSDDVFECPECNKTVPVDKIDTHSDYHLALRLRDEERLQARLERNEKNVTKCSNNQESKKKSTTEGSRNEVSSIASFLVKIDYSIPTEICSECGKRIQKDKFAEHLDFHEAQKLSRELNNKCVPVSGTSNVKRKRLSTSPVKKTKVPCKSIDSFFR